MHKYGAEVIDVHNEYVLLGFERVDGECTPEVGVCCACVKVGKGGKIKYVMVNIDFFVWL
jgi:hypothetical protein